MMTAVQRVGGVTLSVASEMTRMLGMHGVRS